MSKILCRSCMDTGWALHLVSIGAGIDIFSPCFCELGYKAANERPDPRRPRGPHECCKFPAGAFIGSIRSRIEWWQAKKEISAEFWADYLRRHPEGFPRSPENESQLEPCRVEPDEPKRQISTFTTTARLPYAEDSNEDGSYDE